MAVTYNSPGVYIEESDQSMYTQFASQTIGAGVIAGQWGAVLSPQLIDNENTLVNVFGQPNNDNYKNWMSIANYLSYSSAIYVVRMATKGQFNANAKGLTGWKNVQFENSEGEMVNVVDENGEPVLERVGITINNDEDYAATYDDGYSGDFGEFVARYPGKLGNTLLVTYADAKTYNDWKYTDSNGNTYDFSQEFGGAPGTSAYVAARGGANDEIHMLVVDINGHVTGQPGTILEKYSFVSKAADARTIDGNSNYYKRVLRDSSSYVYCLDNPPAENLVDFYQYKVVGIATNAQQQDQFETAGINTGDIVINTEDQMVRIGSRQTTISDDGVRKTSIVFVDYANLSDWASQNIKVYNESDQSIYQIVDNQGIVEINKVEPAQSGMWGTNGADTNFKVLKAAYVGALSGGADDFEYTDADEIEAWDLLNNSETYDIRLCVTGAATPTVARYVVQNICETRMDCVAFISPTTGDRGPILGSLTDDDRLNGIDTSELKILNRTLQYRNFDLNVNSSYAHLDSGWKYQYDKYNDCNRWVPLNGDCAGLYAQVDQTNYPWTVAAGYTRGQIKNVIKLNYSPNKAHRDQLYPQQINPVVTFTGEGTVLYGSKSMLTKPSAFDRLHVRRLFIYLEKNISETSKYLLFELNNATTRAYAVNLIEPLLRYVAGAGGVYSYKVVCDETNNTADIVDQNLLVIDVMVSPAKSIDFINLRFTCTKTGETTYTEM